MSDDTATQTTEPTQHFTEAELRRIVSEEMNGQFVGFEEKLKAVLSEYVKREELEGMIQDSADRTHERAIEVADNRVARLERDTLKRFEAMNDRVNEVNKSLRSTEESVRALNQGIVRITDNLDSYNQRFVEWGEFIKGRDDMVRANNRTIEDMGKRLLGHEDMLDDVIVHRLQPMTLEVFGTGTQMSLRSSFDEVREWMGESLRKMDAWRERQEQKEADEAERKKNRKERIEKITTLLISKPAIGIVGLIGSGLALLLGLTNIQELIDIFNTLFGGG